MRERRPSALEELDTSVLETSEGTPEPSPMPDIFGEQESVVLRPFMSEKSRRVGVPGGRQVDPRRTWQELFSWRGGALKVAATSVSTYVHILVYVLLCVVATVVYDYHLDADDDDDSHDEPFQRDEPRKLVLAFVTLSIDSATVSAIAFLVAFSLARYIGFVVGRFNERFNHCCRVNGAQIMLALDAASMLPTEREAAVQLMRRGLLLQHLLYMGINGKPPCEKDFDLLRQRGLLNDGERATLAMVRNDIMHVYVWAARDVYALRQRGALTERQAERLIDHLGGIRIAAKQRAYHLTPLPMPYFHFTCWSVHVYLLVMEWNSAVRWAMHLRRSLLPSP